VSSIAGNFLISILLLLIVFGFNILLLLIIDDVAPSLILISLSFDKTLSIILDVLIGRLLLRVLKREFSIAPNIDKHDKTRMNVVNVMIVIN
jgi:hypothetical protein